MADPPNTDRSNVPAWNVAAMIDFEDLLRADDGAADETLVARDRAIAAEQIVPVLGENFGDRADSATRRRAFRVWLGARSDAESARREGAGLSAGEAFVHARRLTGAALAVGALISGASVAAGLLNREWRYFNVLLFLAVTLLPQLALLAMLLAGAVFRKALGKNATLGLAQTFARAAVDWLAEKASLRRAGDAALKRWRAIRKRAFLAWPVIALTQGFGVFYNAGLILGFAGCLLVMDVRFFWESTPAMAASESLHALARGLAAPWSWLAPDFVPTLEAVEGTRMTLTGAERGYPEKIDSARAWAPFLAATLLCWGAAPRLLLWFLCRWRESRALQRESFNERPHRELWRRLTDRPLLEVAVSGPADGAVVILWGGLTPADEALRETLLRQLRLNPSATLAAGGADPAADDAALAEATAVLRSDPGIRAAVLVAESWGLAPRDLAPFLKALRDAVGEKIALTVFLTGEPAQGAVFTEPRKSETGVWEDFAARLGDAGLAVRPYRSNRVGSGTQQGRVDDPTLLGGKSGKEGAE